MKLSERYPVGIYAVREKTTLLVPTVGIKCASHAARKLPWPPRSWKAFQAASSLVDVRLRGPELSITRWDGRSERGFVPELEPCTVLPEGISAQGLGEAVLAVLLPLVEKERGAQLPKT